MWYESPVGTLRPYVLFVAAFQLSGCGDQNGSNSAVDASVSHDAGPMRDAPQPLRDGGSQEVGVIESDGGTCTAVPGDHAGLIDYLAGIGFEQLHSGSAATPPTVYQRYSDGRYCHGACDAQPVDWAGYAGQVLQVAGAGSAMARGRFSWSKHTGHGGAAYGHLYLLAPVVGKVDGDSDSWFTDAVDPGLTQAAWLQASPTLEPVAVSRGKVTWSNNGVVAFRSGLIGAVGSGNSNDDFPYLMLGPGRLPTDVAVTNNSEIALVTVWNAASCTSELAVIALTQRDGNLPALPSEGFFHGMKLLGTVPLPVARPARIATALDFSLWMNHSSVSAQQELATQAGRDRWAANTDETHSAADAGYALIASRDENRVVVVDLAPLLQYLRAMYFSTDEKYKATQDVGPGPNQWPPTFDVAPEARPVVRAVLDVPRPSAVAAGFPVGDRSYTDIDFGKKAYVAREDGSLEVYDMTALMTPNGTGSPTLTRTLTACLNPTRIAYGRGAPSRDTLALACRGDRAVLLVEKGGDSIRRLEDSRFFDVVDVAMGDTRGASVLSVADFSTGNVLNYLTSPIDAWGEPLFGGLGEDGKAAFEFTGSWQSNGFPFGLSVAQVP